MTSLVEGEGLMPLLDRFDTPARHRDEPPESEFYQRWSDYVDGLLADLVANPSGGGFYNPTRLDVDTAGEKAMVWMGLPREEWLPVRRDDKQALYKTADEADLRHVQNEYFEWRTERNEDGKVTRVTFVTEFRQYYEELWKLDPDRVVALYNSILGTDQVKEADLQDASGNYDIHNEWNTSRGIIHYIQSINNLSAAVGLCQSAARHNSVGQNNFEASPEFSNASTAVDPRVDYDVNMLVRKGLYVTLRDPIGIYIAAWNNTGLTRPDGTPAPNSWWTPDRGSQGMYQRLVYEVPEGEGFVAGDLSLGGRPLEYGSQLAEQVSVVIHGTAGTKARGVEL